MWYCLQGWVIYFNIPSLDNLLRLQVFAWFGRIAHHKFIKASNFNKCKIGSSTSRDGYLDVSVGWAIAPRSLVRHQSGCGCEGIFETWLTFKWVDLEWSRILPIMWMGLIPSVKDLKSKDWGFPEMKEFCFQTLTQKHRNSAWASRLWTQDCSMNSHLSLQPPGLSYGFWTYQPLQSHEPIP